MKLRRSAFGVARTALGGAVAWGEMAVDDLVHPRRTFDGNDLDAWDPDYIRRVLPLWRATLCKYFRAEVHGLENIPSSGPVAARRKPLRRHVHRGHVHPRYRVLYALWPRASFPPARPRHRRPPPGDWPQSLGDRGRLTRERPEGLRLEVLLCSSTQAAIGRRSGPVGTQTRSSSPGAWDSSS